MEVIFGLLLMILGFTLGVAISVFADLIRYLNKKREEIREMVKGNKDENRK